ncbi:MAG: redoxin family protein [Planctomycetes bacterium]|nr:redoxin family protein [Planctomycetota bacterium]
MRAAGAGLIAATLALALAGCKSTDPKGDDKLPAGVAGRKGTGAKDKDRDEKRPGSTGLSWLDDGKLPGAGTAVPKAGTPTASGDAKAEAQDALGGRVLDPLGRPARNVFVRIDRVGAPANDPAAVGIYTNNEGYFFTRGLKPGQAYDLTAEAKQQDGKPLVGVVQTRVPNPILLIVLRDDLPGPAGGLPAPKGPEGGTFPPAPRPNDKVSEVVPARPAPPKPTDGAWSPGGTISGVPPATIGGGAAPPKPPGTSGGAIPPPDDLSAPPPKLVRPENVADGPKDPFKPPAANIPGPAGPPVPPLPALPPSFGPSGGGRSSMGNTTTTGGSAGKLALVDTLGRPWELDSVKPGSLVLVEFISSTCVPCKRAIPVMKDLQSRYGASGLQVAAVLCDNLPQQERADLAAKYGREQNLNYALFVEPGTAGSVRDRLGVESYPTAFLLNASGKVLWTGHPGNKTELESAIKQNLGK